MCRRSRFRRQKYLPRSSSNHTNKMTTHRCKGKTQAGSQCQRQIDDSRGKYCHQHSHSTRKSTQKGYRRRTSQRGGVDPGLVIEGVQAVGSVLPAAMSAARSAGQGIRRGWQSAKRLFSRDRAAPPSPPAAQGYYPQAQQYHAPPQGYYGYGGKRARRKSHRRK